MRFDYTKAIYCTYISHTSLLYTSISVLSVDQNWNFKRHDTSHV